MLIQSWGAAAGMGVEVPPPGTESGVSWQSVPGFLSVRDSRPAGAGQILSAGQVL